jgi:2-polyprenyl-6-methoxyphenol hydroxylase-like FAD-dependent oxidoreductase
VIERAIVAGAAIGGATTALLLARAGVRVTLCERVAEPRAVGAAILLQPNGLGVLYGLGLGDALRARATEVRTARIATATRTLVDAAFPDFGEGLDHALVVRRSHLFATLLDAVAAEPRIETRFGAEVTAVTRDGEVTAGGETLRADLVIGADGLRSRVRECGDFGARLVPGTTYLRAIAPVVERDTLCEWWTRLGIFGAAPLDDGTYFYASVESTDPAELAAAWEPVLPVAARLFAALRPDDLLVNQVEEVRCRSFVDGRIALLGDAAHAMAPNLGQGANSAMVDAVALVTELRAAELQPALARYDARRRPAVTRVQTQSRRIGGVSEWRNGVARWFRDRAVAVGARLSGERPARAAQQEDPAALLAAVRGL